MLTVSNLKKRFGALIATDDVSLEVKRGEIHALIGPNGAGKSTLANQITGVLQSDAGAINLAGHDLAGKGVSARARLGLARSFQIVSIFKELTIIENVMLAVQSQMGRSHRFWAKPDEEVHETGRKLLARVHLNSDINRRASDISHGEQRQLELAMTLAGDAKLLVLDEPLAGMGQNESRQVVELLKEMRPHYAILLIEHDMDAVFALADRISVLVYGRVVASGDAKAIKSNLIVREAYLGEELEKGLC